jgi:hypothetical protein
MKNTKRTWAFFYLTNDRTTQHVVETFDCKSPERTTLYKLLKKMWQSDPKVTGIGYTTELNSVWLKWPQSELPMTPDMVEEDENMGLYSNN